VAGYLITSFFQRVVKCSKVDEPIFVSYNRVTVECSIFVDSALSEYSGHGLSIVYCQSGDCPALAPTEILPLWRARNSHASYVSHSPDEDSKSQEMLHPWPTFTLPFCVLPPPHPYFHATGQLR